MTITAAGTVCEALNRVSEALWRDDFWLPSNLTWRDVQSNTGSRYPNFTEVWLYPAVLGTLLVLVNHWLLEPRVMAPLARLAGMSSARLPPPYHNSTLERLYKRHSTKVPDALLQEASRAENMDLKQAARWLRVRKRADKITDYDLFLTLSTSLLYSLLFFVCGWAAVYSRPWVWNITLCWQDYPNHPMEAGVWWYYLVVTAHYCGLLVSETVRPRRSNDGWTKMVLHHVCTILLLVFSWMCNFMRVGVLIMLVHVFADIPLLVAKLCRYSGRETLCNVFFACFLLAWLITRCGLYPFWVMRSVFFEATTYMFMPSAYVFMGLLTVLLLLNLAWTFLILRMVFRTFLSNERLKEIHASEDEDSNDTHSRKQE